MTSPLALAEGSRRRVIAAPPADVGFGLLNLSDDPGRNRADLSPFRMSHPRVVSLAAQSARWVCGSAHGQHHGASLGPHPTEAVPETTRSPHA